MLYHKSSEPGFIETNTSDPSCIIIASHQNTSIGLLPITNENHEALQYCIHNHITFYPLSSMGKPSLLPILNSIIAFAYTKILLIIRQGVLQYFICTVSRPYVLHSTFGCNFEFGWQYPITRHVRTKEDEGGAAGREGSALYTYVCVSLWIKRTETLENGQPVRSCGAKSLKLVIM